MTGDPTVDRIVRWIGVVGLYAGLALGFLGLFGMIIGFVVNEIGMALWAIVVLLAGVLLGTAGGYLCHYFGAPWETWEEPVEQQTLTVNDDFSKWEITIKE